MDIYIMSMRDKALHELRKDETFIVRTDIDYSEKINTKEIEEIASIFSSEFEIKESHSPEIQAMKFRCACKKTKGQSNLGSKCPKCGTTVKKIKFPTSKMGYFKAPMKVANMGLLMWLEKILGSTRYKQLIEGKLQGVNDLYSQFEYILDTFVKKKNDPIQIKRIEFLKLRKELLFSEYIPVISSKIRYLSKSENMGVTNLTSHSLNTPLINISTILQLIKESENMNAKNIMKKLYFQLHVHLNEYKNILIDTYGGDKRKLLRDAIYGTRMPYTSWAVLAPLTDYANMDSCTIPIESFRCCFSEEIKKYLLDLGYDMVYVSKFTSVQYALDADEINLLKMIFDIIPDKYIYINRQPTMGKGSIQILEIKEIRDEYVLRIHPGLLDWYGGDHDGDAMVQLGLARDIRKKMHDVMSPKQYVISYDYTVDGNVGLKNDYQVLFYMATQDVEEE